MILYRSLKLVITQELYSHDGAPKTFFLYILLLLLLDFISSIRREVCVIDTTESLHGHIRTYIIHTKK